MMCCPNMHMQNKKRKKNKTTEEKKKTQVTIQEKTVNVNAEVVLPPGSGKIIPNNKGENFHTYTSPNARQNLPTLPAQCAIPQRMAVPSGMSGQFQFMSAKALRNSGNPKLSVTDYLERFLDMYVCLDFWQENNGKKEKCGILNEVGKDFIVLEDTATQTLSVIDLKPVHYINIFCP